METNYGELQLGIAERYFDEILVETAVDASERGGTEKVLSLEAEAKTTGVELLEGEAEVTGKVNYRLLYLDREKRLCGLDYFKDFKCRVKGEEIKPSGKCSVSFSLPDAEAQLRGEEIVLSAMTGVEVRYFGEKSERALLSVTEGECKEVVFCTEKVKCAERTVEVTKTVDSGTAVKKIVLFGADVVPTGQTEREEGKEVNAEVRVSVLYLNEADEAVELSATIPLSEGFDTGAAEYRFFVKNARIVLTEDEGGGAIEAEIAVTIEELSYETRECKAVSVVVLEKSEAVEKSATARVGRYLGQVFREESLTGSVPLAIENGYVAFLRPGCHAIAETQVLDGAVKVEGVAAFQAVCLVDGGYEVQQGELPFSFSLPCDAAKAGAIAEVEAVITEVKGIASGKELSVTAKTSLSVSLFESETVTYLSEVTEGGIYPESEAGISVYFAEKGEDAWSVAKAMKTLPSVLLQGNPFLSEPLVENKKVLIIRKKGENTVK